MSTDNVQVNSKTGIDGNSYTTAISNDKLTNDDFLRLMLEELKMQDPTKPMDSQRMLDSQMQMSNIETNLSLVSSMQALTTSFSQSALSNAANVIGRNIEDGNINEQGINKAYTVRSVVNENGEVTVKGQEMLYLEQQIKDSEGNVITYNVAGEILDADGNTTGKKVTLTNPGQVALSEGKPIILDADNNPIENSGYELTGQSVAVYSDQLTDIPFSSITRIF